MRNRFLVSYDVSDQKRLARTHRLLEGFGTWVQYSVFLCDLSPLRRLELTMALTEQLHAREDRAMIVDLGPVDGRGEDAITWIGIGPRLGKPPASVVY